MDRKPYAATAKRYFSVEKKQARLVATAAASSAL
jgi:hypothetical protein